MLGNLTTGASHIALNTRQENKKLEHIIRLRRHDEIILVQAADLVCPPLKIQIARNHKNLVHRPSVRCMVARNHKARLLSLAG